MCWWRWRRHISIASSHIPSGWCCWRWRQYIGIASRRSRSGWCCWRWRRILVLPVFAFVRDGVVGDEDGILVLPVFVFVRNGGDSKGSASILLFVRDGGMSYLYSFGMVVVIE